MSADYRITWLNATRRLGEILHRPLPPDLLPAANTHPAPAFSARVPNAAHAQTRPVFVSNSTAGGYLPDLRNLEISCHSDCRPITAFRSLKRQAIGRSEVELGNPVPLPAVRPSQQRPFLSPQHRSHRRRSPTNDRSVRPHRSRHRCHRRPTKPSYSQILRLPQERYNAARPDGLLSADGLSALSTPMNSCSKKQGFQLS